MLMTYSHCNAWQLWHNAVCVDFIDKDGNVDYNVNKLNEIFLILCLNMKFKSVVSNHKIIKLIEIKDMGMLHPGEQP